MTKSIAFWACKSFVGGFWVCLFERKNKRKNLSFLMRRLLAREVPRLAFVEVYFGYGMRAKVVVVYFLG
jgi:hypothetical protein